MKYIIEFGQYKFKDGQAEWEWTYFDSLNKDEFEEFIQKRKLSYNSVKGELRKYGEDFSKYRVRIQN